MAQAVAPIPSLSRWGLSPDADLVYRTLVMYGPSCSGALTHDLGVARGRVEEALATLRDAAAIEPYAGPASTARQWAARPVAAVLTSLQRWQQRPRRRLAAPPGKQHHRIVSGLPGFDVMKLGDGLQHLPSREATRLRLGRLVSVTRHEHMTINSEASFDAAALKAAAPMDLVLQSRGVNIRVLGVTSPEPDPLQPYNSDLEQSKVNYRQALTVPMKLIVIDRKVALFPVDPHNFDLGYLEVAQLPVVQSLASTFDEHVPPPPGLTEKL